MRRVAIETVRRDLDALIQAAGRGDEIVIVQNNEPVARLVSPATPAVVQDRPLRRPGRLREEVRMAPDFDDLPDEVLDAFNGAPR